MTAIVESIVLLAGGGAVTLAVQALVGHRTDLLARVARLEQRVEQQARDLASAQSLLDVLRRRSASMENP